MNKVYTIKNRFIKILLNELETAIKILNKYKNKYKYNISIKRNNEGVWNAEIYVSYEK